MTLRELEKRLQKAGCEDPRTDAYILAEHFCGIPRSRLVIMQEEPLMSEALECAVRRREAREPLQYIIGSWRFMNETYEVCPDVLIPRADTETLAEYGIENIPRGGFFADLCSGSGCIAVSTLAARRDLFCIAAEKYESAVRVAVRNAEINGVSDRIKFVTADVTRDFLPPDTMLDAVLTNPPYVSAEEYAALAPELLKEPKAALCDGGDGMSIIEKTIEIYPRHLKSGGFIAIEIGSSQADAVQKCAEKHSMSCEIIRDLSGKDRVAVLKKAPGARL